MASWTDGYGRVLKNIHDKSACKGRPCPIHNPSNHVMKDFPQFWRDDARFMERICPHNVGHPDPDDPFAYKIHGCDGCCNENNN